MSMKVVQISGAYVGAQKTIERAIHREWIKQGNESLILFAIGEADIKGVECYESKIASWIRRGLRKLLGKNPHFAYISTKQLIKRLNRYKPDLVHLHVLHQGYLDYEYLFNYLKMKNIPVVYTMHDMWAFTGGCYYYTKENCLQYQSGCKNCPSEYWRLDNYKKRTEMHFNLKKHLFANINKIHFVAVSQWVANEMKKSFLSEYPITVIDNGVDYHPIQAEIKYKFDKGNITIICVSTAWNDRKGIFRILEIARMLGDNFTILLVGNVSKEIIDIAPDNIEFLGYIHDKSELIHLYASVDLHMSASFEETFGMTFVEAAFVGTRSIGYASSAISNTLKGLGGILIEEMSSEAMVCGIREFINQKNIKLTSDEIKRVIRQYSSSDMAKEYCNIYKSFIFE